MMKDRRQVDSQICAQFRIVLELFVMIKRILKNHRKFTLKELSNIYGKSSKKP